MTTYKYISDDVVAVIDADGVSRMSGLASALVPEGAEIILADPAPVPQVVSRFQARAILHVDGHLTAVEALVAQADMMTKLAWADAQEFRRASPSILAIATALGWTDAYLDDLFIRASSIEA